MRAKQSHDHREAMLLYRIKARIAVLTSLSHQGARSSTYFTAVSRRAQHYLPHCRIKVCIAVLTSLPHQDAHSTTYLTVTSRRTQQYLLHYRIKARIAVLTSLSHRGAHSSTYLTVASRRIYQHLPNYRTMFAQSMLLHISVPATGRINLPQSSPCHCNVKSAESARRQRCAPCCNFDVIPMPT
ncbi:hypothetical protein EVAR_80826_1 [Eumeta japonica]|uniref:Uncharacterized protein n=1 Tax=Eumeta variegata TaxID=151549 RepID=A0A4C1WCP2_EUMVA|nr:hypothetical protein EVAR_80826_1 [Eumeta japonica]